MVCTSIFCDCLLTHIDSRTCPLLSPPLSPRFDDRPSWHIQVVGIGPDHPLPLGFGGGVQPPTPPFYVNPLLIGASALHLPFGGAVWTHLLASHQCLLIPHTLNDNGGIFSLSGGRWGPRCSGLCSGLTWWPPPIALQCRRSSSTASTSGAVHRRHT